MSEIDYGDCLCSVKDCANLAECTLSGDPLCIDCADDIIDRIEAISLHPKMRELLPDFSDR
jgi:hypothetical protein